MKGKRMMTTLKVKITLQIHIRYLGQSTTQKKKKIEKIYLLILRVPNSDEKFKSFPGESPHPTDKFLIGRYRRKHSSKKEEWRSGEKMSTF
jgi:hypothetical protein